MNGRTMCCNGDVYVLFNDDSYTAGILTGISKRKTDAMSSKSLPFLALLAKTCIKLPMYYIKYIKTVTCTYYCIKLTNSIISRACIMHNVYYCDCGRISGSSSAFRSCCNQLLCRNMSKTNMNPGPTHVPSWDILLQKGQRNRVEIKNKSHRLSALQHSTSWSRIKLASVKLSNNKSCSTS